MKDFSQNGEGKIIADYFGERKGVFLDIGANDGTVLSNTRGLSDAGWRGWCIEPSPAAFSKLKALYDLNARVICKCCAITTTDGPVDFYDSGTHLKKGDVALLSTTVPREMDRWKKSGEQFTKTSVRGITFETLMKEAGVTQFSFISIDAEGCDLDILTQIDLTSVGCEMLCIEYNQNKVAEQAMNVYCAKHGMKLLTRNYENLIFVRHATPQS